MDSQNPASPATSHHGTAVVDRTSGPLCHAARGWWDALILGDMEPAEWLVHHADCGVRVR
jgi:hypothetical protein